MPPLPACELALHIDVNLWCLNRIQGNRGKSAGKPAFFSCSGSNSVRFCADVLPSSSLSVLSRAELEALLVELFGEVAALKQTVSEQREEIACLKGLKGRPTIKPSGMDNATEPLKPAKKGKRRFRGKVTPRVKVDDLVVKVAVPEGSRFKGHEPFLVQDLMISAKATCYQRERWITPDGRTILAPLPEGIEGHFGPELRRFVLMQYHQGQSTLPRLAALLRSLGVSISKRQLQRLLTDKQQSFVAEARDVLRAGLETSPYVSADDTGARHAGKNGFCTQIGNAWFTWFGTRRSKSRLNFLDLLRAGHTDYVLNDAAYGYMRKHSLSAPLIASLVAQPQTDFADQAAWLAHLDRLGFTKLDVTPDPVQVATEGALSGQADPVLLRRRQHHPGSIPPRRLHAYRHRCRGAACATADATGYRVSDRAIRLRRKSSDLCYRREDAMAPHDRFASAGSSDRRRDG